MIGLSDFYSLEKVIKALLTISAVGGENGNLNP